MNTEAVVTLDSLENILKEKEVDFKRDGSWIVAETKSTAGQGHKLSTTLHIEETDGKFFASVMGGGEDLFDVDPIEAINQYAFRSVQVKRADGN